MFRNLIGLCLIGLIGLPAKAQEKFWIQFSDKGDISSLKPTDILSPRALENRVLKGIEIDYTDYPLHPGYLKALSMLGIPMENRSRWFNSVSAYLSPSQVELLLDMPFVAGIRPVAAGARIAEYPELEPLADTLPFFGTYLNQLNMLGLDTLHEMGFTGEGVLIAVFDNGFLGVDQAEAFSHLYEGGQILAARDYVDSDDDVYESCIHCRHGTQVLSAMAAKIPGQMMGSAPDASYILLRTEQDDAEVPQEEDNWVAAAEYADSLGAQVFSTSLGYFDFFDDPRFNHSRADLDGNTTVITRAADLAASKGIIVVNSAGNEGAKGVSAPADGDSVIAVGAVNGTKVRASFSSFGYTIDNRIKPDVMAVGAGTFLVNSNGQITRGNGTSYSCPVLSGMLACILQGHAEVSYGQLYQALIQASDRFAQPDSLYGYGIPSAVRMHQLLGGTTVSKRNYLAKGRWTLHPNPGKTTFFLSTFHPSRFSEISLEISDLQGKILNKHTFYRLDSLQKIPFQVNLSPGIYLYSLKNKQEDVYIDGGKLVISH